MTPSSAEQFQLDALTRKVLNLDVTFHWLPGADRFWFRRQSRTGDELVLVDAETGRQSLITTPPPVAPEGRQHDRVVAPNGRFDVRRIGHDLWLQDLESSSETRITTDGQLHFAYGDVDPSYDRQGVARRRAGLGPPLFGVLWSPDSRFVVALRQDLRSLPDRLFVTEYVAQDETYAHTHFRRICTAADAAAPNGALVAYDLKTGALRRIEIDPQAFNDLALPYFIESLVWWSADGATLYLISADRGGARFALNAIDLASGKVRELCHETARFNVRLNPFDAARPNVHVMSAGAELIWYSERDGHGHLYLYDAATGAVIRQLTHGEWVVFDLLHVDEAKRLAYFTAATRQPGEHPYYRYLYRVSLDGGEPQLLTPETADHKFANQFFRGAYRFAGDGTARPLPGSSISPSGRYFVDSYSTTDQPPEYVLRRTSGELIAKVLSSDAAALYATGWKPPERVVAKAADGTTDLHGVITFPRDFDPGRRYPVIDATYPGPLSSWAPRTFMDQLMFGAAYCSQTFADPGFVVVVVDGRGTAHRSRAFRDAFLRTEDVFGAADHVAAIESLAATRPYMDLERVGITGQSFGGYGALRAALLFPGFFKVVVAATGPADYLQAEGQTNVERVFGVPGESAAARAHHEAISNTRLADRLQARTLLIYGGIDESVSLKQAFTVFDAFVKADKDVDMLLIPDAAHAAPRDPYVIRRSVQYFVEHLIPRS